MFDQTVGLVVIAFVAAVPFAVAEDVDGTAAVVSVADSVLVAFAVDPFVAEDVEGTAAVVSVADSAFAALAVELVVVAHAQRHSLVSCCTVCHLCRVSLN